MASGRATRARRGAVRVWRRLRFEQRVAAVGALLLVVSTLGPFSFVEAAEVLIAIGVLWLLSARAEGRRFQLPARDGTVVVAAGAWAGALIAVRVISGGRPLGQNLLALACAAILVLAGLSERSKDPPPGAAAPADEEPEPATAWLDDDDLPVTQVSPTRRLDPDTDDTEPLPPPEFKP